MNQIFVPKQSIDFYRETGHQADSSFLGKILQVREKYRSISLFQSHQCVRLYISVSIHVDVEQSSAK